MFEAYTVVCQRLPQSVICPSLTDLVRLSSAISLSAVQGLSRRDSYRDDERITLLCIWERMDCLGMFQEILLDMFVRLTGPDLGAGACNLL